MSSSTLSRLDRIFPTNPRLAVAGGGDGETPNDGAARRVRLRPSERVNRLFFDALAVLDGRDDLTASDRSLVNDVISTLRQVVECKPASAPASPVDGPATTP